MTVAAHPLRLAPRPVFLAGREELLAELDGLLKAGDDPGPRTGVLCGLGGAGKTSVAVEYAYRHLAMVGLAWQFSAEDATVLAAGFGELAAQLGAREVLDTRDSVASVHGVLAAFPAKWLLVFDNAPNRAAVEAFLPPAGHGRVLITSRDPFWPSAQVLEVPVLDPDIAAEFLVNRTDDANWQAARELAVELGGLPLALEQAAAYMQTTGDSLTGYLASFRQRRADMLVRGKPTGYSDTVATTWALTFERLEQFAPEGVSLLRLLACCAPEVIPLWLLLRPVPAMADQFGPRVAPVLLPLLEDALVAKDALTALRRYSLVSAPTRGLVSVHRLIQAVTLDQMHQDLAAEWQQAAASVIEAAIPDNPQLPETWADFAALLPHAQAALAYVSGGLERIASYVGYSGSYAAARELQRKITGARELALGSEHPDTLTARGHLASWIGEAGDPVAARDQFAALVPVRERVSGPEHPDTLHVRHELAHWTGVTGNWADARDQYAALVPVRERVSGPEHPDTLIVSGHLAFWTGQAGDPAAARDQFAALLPVAERVAGPEHPNVITGKVYLARFTGEAGDPAAARDQFTALVPVRERVSGPEHPDTLIVRGHLAFSTGQAGDAVAARDQFAALVPVRERVSGPEHPDTLHVRHELAHWTGVAGDPAAARDQYAALVPVRERVGGPEHPDTLIVRGHLAVWTGQAGDPAAARDQFAALLSVAEPAIGPEHPNVITGKVYLARFTGEAGDPAAARDQFAVLLPVRERVSGPEHPDTLLVRHELAHWTGVTGNWADARDQYAALVPARERVSGPEHPDTLHARHELARWTRRATATD